MVRTVKTRSRPSRNFPFNRKDKQLKRQLQYTTTNATMWGNGGYKLRTWDGCLIQFWGRNITGLRKKERLSICGAETGRSKRGRVKAGVCCAVHRHHPSSQTWVCNLRVGLRLATRKTRETSLGEENSRCKGLGARDRTSGTFKCLSMSRFGSRVKVTDVKGERWIGPVHEMS